MLKWAMALFESLCDEGLNAFYQGPTLKLQACHLGSHFYDRLNAVIGVQQTSAESRVTNNIPSLLFHCLWYDKLWGPSQRVVTLLSQQRICVGFICIPKVSNPGGMDTVNAAIAEKMETVRY